MGGSLLLLESEVGSACEVNLSVDGESDAEMFLGVNCVSRSVSQPVFVYSTCLTKWISCRVT